jgi:hypothetical protein
MMELKLILNLFNLLFYLLYQITTLRIARALSTLRMDHIGSFSNTF